MQTLIVHTLDGGTLVVAYLPPTETPRAPRSLRQVVTTTGEAVTERRLQERPQLRVLAGGLAA